MNAKLKSLIFTSLSHFSVDGNVFLFPVLIIYYSNDLGLSLVIIGLMPVLYSLISGFTSLFVGQYADKVDRDAFILSSAIFLNGAAVALFILPFLFQTYAYLFMILGSIVLGIAQSVYHPLGATILSYTFGSRESASYMGINGSFGSLGRALLPSLLIFVASVIGIEKGLSSFVIYFIVVGILIFFGLQFFKRRDYGPVSSLTDKKGRKKNTKIVVPFALLLLIVIVFLRSMFTMVSTTYIPDYLDNSFGSKELTAVVILIGLLFPVFGQPLFGHLTSRFGGKFTVSVTSVGTVLFFLFFLLLSKNFTLITLSFAMYALFTFTGFPVLLGYVSQIVTPDTLTRSSSLVWGVGNTVGGSVGLILFDRLLTVESMYNSFLLMITFAIISTVLLIFLPGRPKSKASSSLADI